MKPLNEWPKRWKTHITNAGRLYLSNKILPVRASICSGGGIGRRLSVVPGRDGVRPLDNYLSFGKEIGRLFVKDGKQSANITLTWSDVDGGYIILLPQTEEQPSPQLLCSLSPPQKQ